MMRIVQCKSINMTMVLKNKDLICASSDSNYRNRLVKSGILVDLFFDIVVENLAFLATRDAAFRRS